MGYEITLQKQAFDNDRDLEKPMFAMFEDIAVSEHNAILSLRFSRHKYEVLLKS